MGQRKQIDWEAVNKEHQSLLCLNYKEGEMGVIRLLKNILVRDELAGLWDLPEVQWYEFEFPLPRGRVDLVLFHSDGTISVVEAKNALDNRGIVSGIGQLSMYAVQIGNSKTSNGIRKILTVPIAGNNPDTMLINKACEDAGVIFEPLGTMQEHRKISFDLISNKYPQFIHDPMAV